MFQFGRWSAAHCGLIQRNRTDDNGRMPPVSGMAPCGCFSIDLLCQFFAFTVLSEFVIGQRLSIFEGRRWLTLVTGAFPAVVTAVVSGQRLSTFEGDRGLTLVTGAFPAVVTAVVSGQRLSTFEGDRGLTLGTGAFPDCGDCGCDRSALEHY